MPSLADVAAAHLKKQASKRRAPARCYRLKVVQSEVSVPTLPTRIRIVLDHYNAQASVSGRSSIAFVIPMTPPSTNHDKKIGKNKKTGRPIIITKDNAKTLREMTALAMRPIRARWTDAGTGTLAIVVVVESPSWLTKEFSIRDKDGDNMLKPLVDAIKLATGNPDSKFWDYHLYKVHSKRARTWVYLYDLGDIVESYQ